jgi:hypothetical protein
MSVMRGGLAARAYYVFVVGALMLAGCHNSPTTGSDVVVNPPITPSGDPSAFPPLACPTPAPKVGTTYYVAANQPGADNERCDGLSPTNQGNGRCPFKDFLSHRTFVLLSGVSGVRVEVRSGVYTFATEGLSLSGAGGSESGRIVLTAYENEGVIFDGRNILRELIRVSGQYVTLERVTLQNAGAYNLEVGGGRDHVIQCNRFLANNSSDSLKGDGAAGRTTIRNNDFSQWDSQAIDMANVHDWTIEDNEFHDSKGLNANAIGGKFGTRDILITRNTIRNTRGLTFGGASSPHGNDFEAYNLVAEHNWFDTLPNGILVTFYSCSNCVFRDNDGKTAGAGIVLASEQMQGPSGCAGGCRPSQGTVVTGNRLKDLKGGNGAPPDLFWLAFPSEQKGLSADGNLYCTSTKAQFTTDNKTYLTFPEWTRAIGSDFGSRVVAASDPACGW